MHITLRTAVWFSAGVVIGLALAVPALLLYLRTDSGGALARSYLAEPPQWAGADFADATLGLGTTVTTPNILVAKKDASAKYTEALNLSIRSVNALGVKYHALIPLLNTINAKAVSRDYAGFFDVVAEAKISIKEQRLLADQFSQGLTALTAENQTTKDVLVKSLTQNFITTGITLQQSLAAYLVLIDRLISGEVPTTEQFAALRAKGTEVDEHSKTFDVAAQALFEKLGANALAQ